MSPDALISAQNAPKCVWWPLRELIVALPRPPTWIQKVLLSREREGKCRNALDFVSRFREIEAPVGYCYIQTVRRLAVLADGNTGHHSV